MSQTNVLNFFINIIIFKPITVMICGLLGIPHAIIVALSSATLLLVILLIGKLEKSLAFILFLSFIIVAGFFFAALRQTEYVYNLAFVINFALILILFSLSKNFIHTHRNIFWRFALILTLAVSYIDAVFFDSLTKFDGRNTLVGYDNPLWAARDLGILIFYYFLTSQRTQTFEVLMILATILFFLEARGVFLISVFLYFIKFRPLYLAFGLGFFTAISPFLIDINPYSAARRISEWSSILSNVQNIPLFGFGVTNYSEISFASLGVYPHNFILDLILGFGILGLFFSIWIMFNTYRLLLLKDDRQLHFLMTVPIFYVLAALSQGSLISGMLGLCLIPFGYRINKYLLARQIGKT
tara:strand:- start:16832 stop:17896 length:1065 start_codon:yes stop_codon:yes gene_type:complete